MASSSISTRTVWPNYSTENVRAAAAKPTDVLGKDQFLSILITQLRNQDPMQPLQDKDFIAQMAQFTSVEQLMNMSTELTLMRQSIGSASSLIGKRIEWDQYDETGQVVKLTGVVDSIVSKEGILYAKIGTTEVALDYVTSISETSNEVVDENEQQESEASAVAPGDTEAGDAGDSSAADASEVSKGAES